MLNVNLVRWMDDVILMLSIFCSQLDDSHLLVVREFGLVWFGLTHSMSAQTYIKKLKIIIIIIIILMLAEGVMTKKGTSLEDYVCFFLFCFCFVAFCR